MGTPTVIYALCDPRTSEVRYVGKTNDLATRRRRHRTERGSTHRHSWLANLREAGLEPEVHVLEVCGSDWSDRERWWVSEMRRRECRLTNHTTGGQGMPGHSPTEETRRRLSEAAKADHARNPREMSPAHRAAFVGSRRGRTNSPEMRRKISQSNMGRQASAETRAKISAAQRGKKRGPLSAETRAKIGARTAGERNGQAKLTADDVRAIRAAYPAESAAVLGARYGISPSYVCSLVRGSRWRNV